MHDFTVHIPTQIFFGDTKGQDFSEAARCFGKQALVIAGQGSVKRLGYLDRVLSLLKESEIETQVFDGIEPNPTSRTIQRCVEEHRSSPPDFVVAVGGGSAMDAAKAIAALFKVGASDIWPYVAGESQAGQLSGALPILCVPTTAATASEVTPYAVISNPEVNGKSHLGYEFLKPKASWINPMFTLDIPPRTTQDGAADILSHVFENYLLGGNDAPLTDRYCEAIMRTVIETLPEVLKSPRNSSLRGTLLWCSTLALNGYHAVGRNPSLFVLHNMEHALSGFQHELAHGRGLATLYPAYFRFLWKKDRARERFARLYQALFDGDASAPEAGLEFIKRFEQWLVQNQLYQSLSSLGVEPTDFPAIAKEVMRVHAPQTSTLDVLGTFIADDIISIFEATEAQH